MLLLLALVAAGLVVVVAVLLARERARMETARGLADARERKYHSLFESSVAGIALVSADGTLLEWNTKLRDLLGTGDEAAGAAGFVRPVEWEKQAETLARLARQQAAGAPYETSLIDGDGKRRWLILRHSPIPGAEDGAFWLLVSDVTRRQETRLLLRLAQQIYSSISEAILITDATTRIVEVNPAFERMTGYTRKDAIGMRTSALRSPRHDAGFFDAMWAQLSEKDHWFGEIWNLCRDGAVIPCWMHIDAVRDPRTGEITHYVGCFSDISERKSIEDRISFLAHHDPLTGLSNRFSLDAVLPQSIAMARRNEQRVALLFVDLDHFKEINDNHGHSTGDQVLIEVGRRLMNSVRDSDFLARIGGDEFVILLNEIDGTDDALRVASSVLEALRRPIVAGGAELTITPSIGISLFPEDGEEAATLLGCADHAMYQVKTDGRDGYRFHSSSAG
jgi:diguanylate cyclase (GGDEF)-like protein/PAS domain S-box-containing protein